MDRTMLVLTFLSALGCGLVAGVFFAFSTFVMRALVKLSPVQGIAAMQSINVTVINPAFMIVLFGTAALSIVVAIGGLFRLEGSAWMLMVAGGVLYLFGTIGVTLGFNVPLNNLLAEATPGTTPAAETWKRYAAEWTRWNHVRMFAALLGAAAFALAFRAM